MSRGQRLLGYVFWAAVSALLAWMIRKMFQSARVDSGGRMRGPARTGGGAQEAKSLFRDPVCGTYVAGDISQRLIASGENLHFCSRDCMERYQSDLRARDDRRANRLAAGA